MNNQIVYFPKVTSPTGMKSIDLEELYERSSKDSEIKKLSEAARATSANKKKYEGHKLNLPCVMTSVAKTKGAKASDIQALNQYIQIDVDETPDGSPLDEDDITHAEDILSCKPYVRAVFRSGRGVKAIAQVERSNYKIDSPQDLEDAKREHLRFFRHIDADLDLDSVKIDPATKDLARKGFVWHNPGFIEIKENDADFNPLSYKELPEDLSADLSDLLEVKIGSIDDMEKQISQELADVALRLNDPDADRSTWLKVCLSYIYVSHRLGTPEDKIIDTLDEWSSRSCLYNDKAQSDLRDFVKRDKSYEGTGVDIGTLLLVPRKNKEFNDKLNAYRYEQTRELPTLQLDSYAQMESSDVQPVRPVIANVLGVGEKLMIAAPSKMGKTQVLLNLAKVTSTSGEWFGFQIPKLKVLFLNFEFTRERMYERLTKLGGGFEHVAFLHLRGKDVTIDDIIAAVEQRDFSLIILDPIYKILSDVDENSNTEVTQLLGKVEKLAKQLGAAIVYAHHFSKGSKSGTAQIDRASGAGAWSRDADGIMTFTEHSTEGCYTSELTLRHFASPEKSVWRSTWPYFEQVVDADPNALKKRGGSNAKLSVNDVVAHVRLNDGLTKSQLKKALAVKHSLIEKTTGRWVDKAIEQGKIILFHDDVCALPAQDCEIDL